MNDYLATLAARTLGLVPQVRPLLRPRFAPGPSPSARAAPCGPGEVCTRGAEDRGSELGVGDPAAGALEPTETEGQGLAHEGLSAQTRAHAVGIARALPAGQLMAARAGEGSLHPGNSDVPSLAWQGLEGPEPAAQAAEGASVAQPEAAGTPTALLGSLSGSVQSTPASRAHRPQPASALAGLVNTPALPGAGIGLVEPEAAAEWPQPRGEAVAHTRDEATQPRSDWRILVPLPGQDMGTVAHGLEAQVRSQADLPSPETLRESPPTAIQVTIGRVEVRAVLPPAPQPAPTRPGPAVSLDDYLKRRERGSR